MSDTPNSGLDQPAIPEEVYHFLPTHLKELTDHFSKWYERDAFFTSLIGVLSAALPSVRFQYGKDELSPHLYCFVVAAAASGKGAVGRAFRILDLVDRHLLEKSAVQQAAWRDEMAQYKRSLKSGVEEQRKHPGNEPPELVCTVGEDTTLAKLVGRLGNNPEGVFMGSTEADSIAQAIGQQHGGFGHVLRKAYHHEPVIQDRQTRRSSRVMQPRLALVLAGTSGQVTNLLEGVSDGLFSRFAIYEFTAPLQYESQRPSRDDKLFATAIEAAQKRVFALYTILKSRKSPLRVSVSRRQWDRVDTAYQSVFESVFESESAFINQTKPTVSPLLAASIKRGAMIVFRILAILSVWRCFEREDDLAKTKFIEPDDVDVGAAIGIGLVYTEHALTLALRLAPTLGEMPDLSDATDLYRMSNIQREWWGRLPGQFEFADAESVGSRLSRSRATVYRWIDRFIEAGLLLRSDAGQYTKTASLSDETNATDENSSDGYGYAQKRVGISSYPTIGTPKMPSHMSHSSHCSQSDSTMVLS